LGQSVKLVPLA